ncbi:TonB-dependent receptor domain-containing protein [Pseudoalteromonas agarivorans]|uniref:TonB-dependent receptor domain-containing protein n=1 Tax=Pseudoalteromonas agarivorans TaxID=176102 RepID=UPI0003D62003|nr:TonB-dependent receptor [Pseudoalteromonas agarivorans]ETJ46914.1 TonB-denpendent receptor [Pseudoalteromonas agarivorans]
MLNNKVSKAVRLAIAFGAASAAAFSASSSAAEEGVAKVERIQVTGSRIKRTDVETPVPVTIIGRTDIEQMGALNVADVLNQSPVAIAGADQSNSSFSTSGVGLNTTSLRNLGEARTLVLVNGRRFVSGRSPSSGYAVDLNAIPASMIERIEILKSASSAIYGTDAVAGVVNIITRDNVEGVEVNAQTGISGEGDREKYSLNLTAGNSWDSGNVTVAIGYDDDKGLKPSDRAFSEFDEAILLDENGNEYVGKVFSSYTPQGRVGSYNADGTPYTGLEGGDAFNRADYRQLVTPLERKYAALNIKQEINDEVEFFAEMNWNSSKTYNSTIEPTPFSTNDVFLPERGGEGGIKLSNPMVPELLRENLLNDGYGLDDNIPELVRRMVEFGARSTDLERDTVRIATGIDWMINDDWSLNTYVSWGKTDQRQDSGGQVNIERAAQAFDVVQNDDGSLQCANDLAVLQGCVPLNLFGEGSVSAEAVDYVKVPAKIAGQTEQFIVSASLVGELPVELAGGRIGVAMGAEHRLESGFFNPGDLAQTGASSTNRSLPTDGSYYSNDYYVETILPILDNLELDLAARYSDHEIVGGQTTWNAGIQYSPIDTLKFRASAATAIRTPNIADLFGGRGETFANVTDPCSGVTASSTGNVAQNCLSIPEIAARVAANGSFELTQTEAQSTGGFIGGNEEVQEETADTYSLGVVWQATEEFALTVDYYDISVEDAISTTSRTTVLNRCFDVSAADFDSTCGGNSLRDQNGALVEVNSGTSNENNIETAGVDIELAYKIDTEHGEFGANLIWNHLIKYDETGIISGETVEKAGQVFTPDNRANLNLSYGLEDLNLSWRMRYWDRSKDSVDGGNFNYTDFTPLEKYNEFPSVVYHDISAGYSFSDSTNVTLTVRNLFDKQPPVANQSSSSGGTGINTVSEAYDVTGRYLQLSLTTKF